MKKITLMFVFFLFLGAQLFSQVNISGTVLDEDNFGIPGATVRVKGSTEGTITDLDGKYTLTNVPSSSTTLIFSFVGLETKEVAIAGQTVINVSLGSSDQVIEEIAVVALGIKRDTKKLGYSATQVDNEALTSTSDRSALNALQGKIAGVNITQASGAPGSSTRVIMRGFTSVNGSNQPLFVIDGVPINNAQSGSDNINGGTDFGNGANDINPEDISSMTVLKGAAGVALYGSRAANGVIIITTKSGLDKSGLEVSVASAVNFDTPLRLPDWQNEYGQGFFGKRDIRENTSWGPKFDGAMRYWGYRIDGKRLIKPYEALPNNVRDFFDVGATYNNSVSFAGGKDNTSFYASYSNIYADGIMPSKSDFYSRNNLAIRGSAKLTNNFSIDGSMNYVNKRSRYVMTGQGESSVYNQILQTPRDISLSELSDYNSMHHNLDNFYNNYALNPYYVLNEFGNGNNSERVFGNVKVGYTFSDYLSAFWRIGTDVSNDYLHQHSPIIELGGMNEGATMANEGSVDETNTSDKLVNSDFIINYTQSWDKFDISLMAGNNIYQEASQYNYAEVIGLNVPGFYNLSNSGSTPAVYESNSLKRLVGAYINADASFLGMLYLTASYRRDWSSTLPKKNNNFGYPGVSLGFVFTELLPKNNILTFGKIRTGWGKVGKDAWPYLVYSTFSRASYPSYYSQGTGLSFPITNGINAYSVGNRIGNANLSPEFKTETEIGLDLRFFNGMITLDAAVYKSLVTDLIFSADLPGSTGYTGQVVNFGEITNQGLEILVTVTPIKKPNFVLDLSFNYTKNINKLLTLPDSYYDEVKNQKIYNMTPFGETYYNCIVKVDEEGNDIGDLPLGVFVINPPRKVEDEASPYYGYYIVDNTGKPIEDESKDVIIGDSQYDYMTGGSIAATIYKNWNIKMSIDIRQGGLMFSRTADMTYFSGTNKVTLYNDRQPFIVPNSVIEILDANQNVVGYQENTTHISNAGGTLHEYWGNGGTRIEEFQFLDKSFIKLRDVTVSYSLPKRYLKKTFFGSMDFSLIGRNLLLWTPAENMFIDPEATSFGNDLGADFGEWGNTPSIRSIGGSIKFTF